MHLFPLGVPAQPCAEHRRALSACHLVRPLASAARPQATARRTQGRLSQEKLADMVCVRTPDHTIAFPSRLLLDAVTAHLPRTFCVLALEGAIGMDRYPSPGGPSVSFRLRIRMGQYFRRLGTAASNG